MYEVYEVKFVSTFEVELTAQLPITQDVLALHVHDKQNFRNRVAIWRFWLVVGTTWVFTLSTICSAHKEALDEQTFWNRLKTSLFL